MTKRFFSCTISIKLFKAAKAGQMVLIVERMAQDWAKRLKADPEWNVFEKQARKDKRRLEKFEEKHKK